MENNENQELERQIDRQIDREREKEIKKQTNNGNQVKTERNLNFKLGLNAVGREGV